jgi:hypothetical protein
MELTSGVMQEASWGDKYVSRLFYLGRIPFSNSPTLRATFFETIDIR